MDFSKTIDLWCVSHMCQKIISFDKKVLEFLSFGVAVNHSLILSCRHFLVLLFLLYLLQRVINYYNLVLVFWTTL